MSRIKKCIQCDNQTSNPKFCSMSCSAKYNNQKFPKRKPEGICKGCGLIIKSKANFCSKCNFRNKDMTLEQAVYYNHHKASAYALVRSRARAKIKKLGINKCSECGYDKHIEVGHIKPISEFDKSTLLSVINDISNLTVLCPNHHWEFDNCN